MTVVNVMIAQRTPGRAVMDAAAVTGAGFAVKIS